MDPSTTAPGHKIKQAPSPATGTAAIGSGKVADRPLPTDLLAKASLTLAKLRQPDKDVRRALAREGTMKALGAH